MRPTLSRHRRLLAAVFAAAAAAFGLAATRPHVHGVRVLVAARDLAGGTRLGSGDVTARTFPAAAVPAGAVLAGAVPSSAVPSSAVPSDAVTRAAGRILSGPMRRGEPVTDVRLSSGSLLHDGDPTVVATPVRLADAAVARLLHAGDRVDVLAARTDGPLPARTIAAAVPVIAVPRPGPETDEGALVVLRTGREQAAALARAAVDSRLSVTILGP